MSSKKHWLKREMQKLERTRGCWGGQRLGWSQCSLGWVVGGQKGGQPQTGTWGGPGRALLPQEGCAALAAAAGTIESPSLRSSGLGWAGSQLASSCCKGRLDGGSLSLQCCWDDPGGFSLELGTGLFLPGLGQGVSGCLPWPLDEHIQSSRSWDELFLGSCGWPSHQSHVLRTSLEVRDMWHCWLLTPSTLKPTSPGTQFTPWCQMGAAAVNQSPGPAVCAAFTQGEVRLGGVGPALLRIRTVHPAPREMAVRVALLRACQVLPAPCTVREGA